jgi:hypothetical protein
VPFGNGAMIKGEPALFSIDWKSSWLGHAVSRLGLPGGSLPPAIPRTHTAIEDGVAASEMLFTTIDRSIERSGGM